jgi:hypothetical protein
MNSGHLPRQNDDSSGNRMRAALVRVWQPSQAPPISASPSYSDYLIMVISVVGAVMVIPLPSYAIDTSPKAKTELAKSTETPVIRIASILSRLFLRRWWWGVILPSLFLAEDAPSSRVQ